jgi:uncharacterized protein YcfJ
MMTKPLNRPLASLLTIALAGIPAAGAAPTDFVDTAPVISATPIIERVYEPRQECWTDTAATPDTRGPGRYVAPVLGAVVGGLLGSMMGSGNGRVAAGAIGAGAGAIAGQVIGEKYGTAAQPAQQCRTVDAGRDVVKGYHVVYRYNGRDVATTLPYDPGRTVRVGTGILDDDAGYGGDYRNPGSTASRSDYRYGPAPRYDYTGATMSPNTPYYSY